MKKNKHDHKGTKALKLTIFFTLMLAPFLAVLFKCAYVTFNKNAKDSYTSNEVLSQNLINNQSSYISGGNYNLVYFDNGITTSNYSNKFYFITCSLPIDEYHLSYQPTYFRVRSDGWIYVGDDVNTQATLVNHTWGSDITQITFTSANNTLNAPNQMNGGNTLLYLIMYREQKLDNAFYYAIDEAMESPYFAWARTSALYTATSGLTNGMGITTQAIPTLIVYWLILTAIYIIIDIVIESFTYLTHCIMNRFE